jgi:hypothetical protein
MGGKVDLRFPLRTYFVDLFADFYASKLSRLEIRFIRGAFLVRLFEKCGEVFSPSLFIA